VLVAIFENKDYDQIAGNRSAPYLNALMGRAAVLRNSRGVAHPSQPNYLALFSGSTQGVRGNGCFNPLRGRANLGRQLLDTGRTFVGYSEGLPRAGYTGCWSGRYAAKHNPWVHFANLPDWTNQPLTALPRDLAALPTVAFVVPDLCNDMHDCPIRTGDSWARAYLDPYLRWADTHDSLLVVTFDENDNRPGNRILTLFAGARVRPGVYDEAVDHYRVLRTLESLYGLSGLGQAADKRPLTDIWR
jgi:acid phosphatase